MGLLIDGQMCFIDSKFRNYNVAALKKTTVQQTTKAGVQQTNCAEEGIRTVLLLRPGIMSRMLSVTSQGRIIEGESLAGIPHKSLLNMWFTAMILNTFKCSSEKH